MNPIEILYKAKTGKILFPHLYGITRANAAKYPVQIINGNIRLRIIPITDLEVLKRLDEVEVLSDEKLS